MENEESYVEKLWIEHPWSMRWTWFWMDLHWWWGWLRDVPAHDMDTDKTVGMRTGNAKHI